MDADDARAMARQWCAENPPPPLSDAQIVQIRAMIQADEKIRTAA